MKTFVAILALVGFASAVPAKSVRNLGDDIQDFIDLLPLDQLLSTAETYLLSDTEVQADFEYLQSDEVKAVINEINSQQEVIDLYSWINDHGFDIYSILNTLNDLLGWDHVNPPSKKARSLPSHRTFQDLLDAEIALIPVDKLQALFEDKKTSSEDFKELYAKVTSQEFRDFVDSMFNQDDVQAVLTHLKDLNVDVDAIVNFLKDLLGWS